VVYGAGAVGSYLGARLAAVMPVTLIARREHVEAIQGRGLFVGGAVDLFVPPGKIRAVTGLSSVLEGTLVVVTVKMAAAEEAGRALAAIARPDSVFLLLQNGLTARQLFLEGAARELAVARAVASCGVDFREAGKVEYWGGGLEFERGARSAELVELFRRAGLDAGESPDFARSLWTKLAANCMINPITALLGCRNSGAMVAELAGLRRRIVSEVAALAKAEGLELEAGLAERIENGLASGGNRSSMLQDLAAGRSTEIEYLNGFVVRRSRELGMQAPVNEVLAELIRGRARTLAGDAGR
jgi:2-dehydropantoate 2-reductase